MGRVLTNRERPPLTRDVELASYQPFAEQRRNLDPQQVPVDAPELPATSAPPLNRAFPPRDLRAFPPSDLDDQIRQFNRDVISRSRGYSLPIREGELFTAPIVDKIFASNITSESKQLGLKTSEATQHVQLRAQMIDQRVSLLAPSDYDSVLLVVNLCRIAKATKDALRNTRVRATDITSFIRHELSAAYDGIMARAELHDPQAGHDVELPDEPGLLFRADFIEQVVDQIIERRFELPKGARPDSDQEQDTLEQWYDLMARSLPGNLKQRGLGAMCWVIMVDAGLLNRRLRQELRRYKGVNHYVCPPDVEKYLFYIPYTPDPEFQAHFSGVKAWVGDPYVMYQQNEEAFRAWVKARWPIIAFALDPVIDQQNILDAYSLRRDLQLAFAFSFSSGQASFDQLTRFMRRIEQDAETVALNRTVTTYAHGNHTFGWRFYPRYQNPPTQSNLQALAGLLTGGPGVNYQLKQSKLEAGQRDLTAVVVMPSFLPEVRLESTGNWFPLHEPDQLMVPTSRMLEQGRRVERVKQAVNLVCNAGEYRPDDVRRLVTRTEQLEAMLPMQTAEVRMPFESDLSGTEMLSQGATSLVPILLGYEGADSIDPEADFTDLLIFGKHISIYETKVVIGGQFCDAATVISMTAPTVPPPSAGAAAPAAPASGLIPPGAFEIVSRGVVRVRVVNKYVKTTVIKGPITPAGTDNPERYVEIHLATPTGISNRILIPYGQPMSAGQAGYALEGNAPIKLSYQWFRRDSNPAAPPVLGASMDPEEGGTSIKVKWEDPKGFAPKSVAVRLQGVANHGSQRLAVQVQVLADGGNTGSYSISPKDLACCLLARLSDPGMFRETDALPSSIDFTVEVRPVPQADFRVQEDWKKLGQALKVQLDAVTTGNDVLRDCKCVAGVLTEAAAKSPSERPAPASAYSLHKDTQKIQIHYEMVRGPRGVEVTSGVPDPARQKIQIDWDGPVGAGAPSIRVVFRFVYGATHFDVPVHPINRILAAGHLPPVHGLAPGAAIDESAGSYVIDGRVLANLVHDYVDALNAQDTSFSAMHPLPSLTTESIEITPVFRGGGVATKAVKCNNQLTIEPK
jgi:hypothetical protein